MRAAAGSVAGTPGVIDGGSALQALAAHVPRLTEQQATWSRRRSGRRRLRGGPGWSGVTSPGAAAPLRTIRGTGP